jgi:hypothetical protein
MIEIHKNVTTRSELVAYAALVNVSEGDILAALQLHGRYAVWAGADSDMIVRCGRFDFFLMLGVTFLAFSVPLYFFNPVRRIGH